MKTGSLVITMSTYSGHKGDSGADVGLDPAHAHAHATHIVAEHLKLEWVGGGTRSQREWGRRRRWWWSTRSRRGRGRWWQGTWSRRGWGDIVTRSWRGCGGIVTTRSLRGWGCTFTHRRRWGVIFRCRGIYSQFETKVLNNTYYWRLNLPSLLPAAGARLKRLDTACKYKYSV